MDKRNIKLIATATVVDNIREKALKENVSVGEFVRGSLKKWFIQNESELEQFSASDSSNLRELSIRVDEDTELLYTLFLTYTLNQLFKESEQK